MIIDLVIMELVSFDAISQSFGGSVQALLICVYPLLGGDATGALWSVDN
jgi:hypothetical protein